MLAPMALLQAIQPPVVYRILQIIPLDCVDHEPLVFQGTKVSPQAIRCMAAPNTPARYHALRFLLLGPRAIRPRCRAFSGRTVHP